MDIRYPAITGKTTEERMEQLERYLHYLVQVLNFQLRNL